MSFFEIITTLEMGLLYSVVTLGIYFTFRIIDFPDLSVDGSFVTGSAACVMSINKGVPSLFSIFIGFIAGGFSGLFTGLLHVYGRITPLLSGIITAFMLYSVNLRILEGVPNQTLPTEASIFVHISPLLFLSLICLFLWCITSYSLYTHWGLALRAMGSNKKLALLHGIKIPSYTLWTLIISNGFIGLAGGIACHYQYFVDVSSGVGTVIMGLAALLIGEKLTSSSSITWIIFSCITGSLLYRFIIGFALHIEIFGLTSSDLNMITGVVIICIMIAPKRRFSSSIKLLT